MDDLRSRLDTIRKIMKECEQSKLTSFVYQDSLFSIQFSKVMEEKNCDLITSKKETIENNFDFKIENKELESNFTISDLSQSDNKETEDIITIVSPFVGTVEFVNQIKLGGDNKHINKGEVICSIEAMKLLNDITSPVAGTIFEILVKDGHLVEYEQPILKIRADKNE